MENKRWLIIIIGAPGSGKGTQAELLAQKFGLFHFETSKIIEDKLANADPNDPVMASERELHDTGELNTPELVQKWVMEKVNVLAESNRGIVFSGSPRTLPEAENELLDFERLYGKENIKVIEIKLSREESFSRNSHRRICRANRHPIPNFKEFENIIVCPRDGSDLIVRGLDDPEVIKERYDVYLRRTEPIVNFMRSEGYSIIEIDGEQSIDKVAQDILDELSK